MNKENCALELVDEIILKNFLFTPVTRFGIFHQIIIRHVPNDSCIKRAKHVARYTLEDTV